MQIIWSQSELIYSDIANSHGGDAGGCAPKKLYFQKWTLSYCWLTTACGNERCFYFLYFF